jgi:hypothetical protein
MAENKNAKTPTDDGQPVAWLKTWSDGSVSVLKTKSHAFADHELEPLYAAPQKHDYVIDCPRCGHCCQALETEREWIGLTDEEIQDLSYLSQKIDASNSEWFDRLGFYRAVEQALKEKNHG